ncbi:hypothetical protein B0T14DRAFT_569180 [Immersiella caudata]|uniref:Zn(2)-C6 fungal-type domain-containing protein n=1 Tax=Immersiella caudata TaxID=314043 RepID=A0AA40BXY3_9PEZI|nr:hypothetical protein B0T14DRAFT_569180 [Immersiella caudata]
MPRTSVSSPPDPIPAPHKRLPVNPRRKKVPLEARRRVATACNSCNVRRIKCNGGKPCSSCAGSQRECLYPPPITKMTVNKTDWDTMKQTLVEWETYARMPSTTFDHLRIGQADDQSTGDMPTGAPTLRDIIMRDYSVPAINPEPAQGLLADGQDFASGYAESETSTFDGHGFSNLGQGKMLADGLGRSRFHGETSGATFQDTLKFFLKVTGHILNISNQEEGFYQTDDSHPLLLPPEHEVDARWLPPTEEMKAMISEMRVFVTDGAGTSGGAFYWPLHEDLDTVMASLGNHGISSPSEQDPSAWRGMAFYNACFAFVTLLRARQPGSRVNRADGESEAFLARARKLMGNPFDVNLYSIDDVPTLALMALYYVEYNRRDFACSFINIAMNLCRMHGVDRGSSANPSHCRVFWTLYILDRWLSCLMGRIPSVPDFAIQLPLPQECRGLPSHLGLRAHVELSYISNFIVHDSCRGTRGEITDGLPEGVRNAHVMLDQWKNNLPQALQITPDPDDPDFVNNPSYGDRAHCLLHMSYNQLYILTVRPAFLGAVTTVVAHNKLRRFDLVLSKDMNDQLHDCSNKARENIALAKLLRGDRVLVEGMGEIPGSQPLLVQELHHLFNAALILMMHQIVYINLRTKDTDGIDRAIRIFTEEADIGSVYAKNCVSVLNDFKIVVHKLREDMYSTEATPEQGPGEGIFSSLVPIPAFEAPAPTRVRDELPSANFRAVHGAGDVPRQSPPTGPPFVDSPERTPPAAGNERAGRRMTPEVVETLEKWAAKGVTGSYTDVKCMVDEEAVLVIRPGGR